jgi:hypothetical protein
VAQKLTKFSCFKSIFEHKGNKFCLLAPQILRMQIAMCKSALQLPIFRPLGTAVNKSNKESRHQLGKLFFFPFNNSVTRERDFSFLSKCFPCQINQPDDCIGKRRNTKTPRHSAATEIERRFHVAFDGLS